VASVATNGGLWLGSSTSPWGQSPTAGNPSLDDSIWRCQQLLYRTSARTTSYLDTDSHSTSKGKRRHRELRMTSKDKRRKYSLNPPPKVELSPTFSTKNKLRF
jgi:hypothetical protein